MARIRRNLVPAVVAIFLPLVTPAQEPRGLHWTEANVQAKAVFNSGSEKIDPALLAIAASAESKGLDGLEATAKGFGVTVDGDRVPITLIAEDAADVARLRSEVKQRGGTVTTDYQNRVFAMLPAKEIPSLAKLDDLYSAVRQNISYADQDAVKDGPLVDGVLKIRADLLHKAGVRGQGVKVGILDFGFQGYAELQAAGYVPAPVQTKVFNKSGRFENGVVHGTACAEIVHAMAPDAQLYLAAMGEGGGASEDDIIQGAKWLQAQGVDVISYSGGSTSGAHNGKDLLDLLVEDVTRDHHILWVNAAGNEGRKHALVNATPGTGDWIPVSGQLQFLKIVPKSPYLSVQVNWDDWGDDPLHPASTQDIDIEIIRKDKEGNILERKGSYNVQKGRMPPSESIDMDAIPGEDYWLGLHASHLTRALRVHVYCDYGLEPASAIGSIGIPATSNAALAVGAVDVTNGKLEPYSSRGPTDDDRAKPELSSYDNVSSASYKRQGRTFTGTSAACPHVSGFAALIKSQMKDGDAVALRARLIAAVKRPDSEDPGFGAGITDAGALLNGGAKSGQTELPTDAGALELPESLGGSVTAESLKQLTRDRGDQPFDVKVRLGRDGNPPVYHIGDDLRLGFSTQEDAYCALINRDAEGRYTVLPLESERLEAGHKYVYPDKIRVSEPTGSEEFIFVCAKKRVDLNRWKKAADEGGVSVDVAGYEVKP